MTFEDAFQQALLDTKSDRLPACMEMLLERNDFVPLAELDPSAQQVMGNFSTRIQTLWGCAVTKERYLCLRNIGHKREAYRLKPELSDIVEEVLARRRELQEKTD